jgi:arginyl-tRNA synthetase
MMRFPDMIALAAEKCEPHIMAEYLKDLSSVYHVFYHERRIIGAGSEELTQARLALSKAVRQVLKNGLGILGISAPEKM